MSACSFSGVVRRHRLAGRAEDVVRLGVIDLSIHAGVGRVLERVLIDLGHRVEVSSGSHDEIYPRLGSEAIDLLAAVWLPNTHGTFWAAHAERTVQLGRLYENARLYWAVPNYVAEADVSSIADLAGPSTQNTLDRRLLVVGAGSGLTARSREALSLYGLDRAGYAIAVTTSAERTMLWREAYAKRLPFVMAASSVQWVNKAFAARPLADPNGILGGSDTAILVATKKAAERLPERTRQVLSRVGFSLDDVIALDHAISIDGASAQRAAEVWLAENLEKRVRWLTEVGENQTRP